MATLKVPIEKEDHTLGHANAPIVIVEYGDYECPYCKSAHVVLKEIQENYKNKLLFVFRNFPLTELHAFAEAGAETAEFAGSKGKYWEMHDMIYESQEPLSLESLFSMADDLGLPIEELEKALEKGIFQPRIQKDFLGGVRSGVNGTPTLFINNQRFNGPVEFDAIVSAIELVSVKP